MRLPFTIMITEKDLRSFVRSWQYVAKRRIMSPGRAFFQSTGFAIEWRTIRGRRLIRSCFDPSGEFTHWRDLANENTPAMLYCDLAGLVDETQLALSNKYSIALS